MKYISDTYLKLNQVNRILIVPVTLDGVNSDTALEIHGLDEFIKCTEETDIFLFEKFIYLIGDDFEAGI